MAFSDYFALPRILLLSLSLVVTLPLVNSQAAAQGQLDDIFEPWIMPFDVDRRFPDDTSSGIKYQNQFYEFMWRTFVALNWPQLDGGDRAEPDTFESLPPWDDAEFSEGPVVWESYLRPNQVFVKPKDWPFAWNDPTPPADATCPPVNGLEPLMLDSFMTNYSSNSDGLNQPYIQANYSTGPVADQNGNYLRYDIGLNQAYFTYIGRFRYYDPRRQAAAVQRYIQFVEENDGATPPVSENRNTKFFQALPNGSEGYLQDLHDYAHQGIVEWKAAWKVLGAGDIPERFYRRPAFFLNPDGSCTGPTTVGLIALHIHRVSPDGMHSGTTFEQVDNTNLQPAYSNLKAPDAAPLPANASLNPGSDESYPNGYEVCDPQGNNCKSGMRGILPKPLQNGAPLPINPQITNVSRAAPIAEDVQTSNAIWRKRLEGTVWFYYQMIGTQNANVNEDGKVNSNLGPGVRGAQVSSTNQLINTALESYTQPGVSCAQCHQNASPLGVSLPLPPFGQAWDALRTISFLLQNAQTNGENE